MYSTLTLLACSTPSWGGCVTGQKGHFACDTDWGASDRPLDGTGAHRTSDCNTVEIPPCVTIKLEQFCSRILTTFPCSPTRRRTHATRMWMVSDGPADSGQRFRRASGAWLVEPIHGAYPPGLRSALHRHPHVAPRSAMTLNSVWGTCAEKGAHAEPSSGEPAQTTY